MKGTTTCFPCLRGEYQDQLGLTSCKICPVNTKSKERNSSNCEKCNEGKISEEGSPGCLKCEAGKASTGINGTCDLCFAGQFRSSDMRATTCEKCQLGKTTSIEGGATKCEMCDYGKFGSSKGICSDCPEGQYQDRKGQTECIECNVGESYVSAKTSCSGCGLGKKGSSKGKCSACPAGRYQDGRGAKTCIKCERDTYLSEEGKSSKADCQKCSADRSTGTATGNINASFCLCKRIDFYQNNQNICEPCPLGADCSMKDGIVLEELSALPGYWRSTIATVE